MFKHINAPTNCYQSDLLWLKYQYWKYYGPPVLCNHMWNKRNPIHINIRAATEVKNHKSGSGWAIAFITFLQHFLYLYGRMSIIFDH
jgi:hypothetical protein